MATEIGEYIVGSYLRIIKDCDFIDYNVRRIEGGIKGLDEIDVIGLQFAKKTAYLCEVTTHIRGLLIGNNQNTVAKIRQKYENLRYYAKENLADFPKRHFMFWSPIVSEGYITERLKTIKGLEVIINKDYTRCIDELRGQARIMSNDTGNPFFRTLQILERLKKLNS
jgi:hypothetical protein